LLASLFAEKAVELICEGKGNLAVGLHKGAITSLELENAANKRKHLDLRLLKVSEMLSI
jgi:6-phosphofructokinase